MNPISKLFNRTRVTTLPGGTKEWRRNGHLHRDDGPAVEYPSGTREWWRNGVLHRDGAPAIEHANGTKFWYSHGHLHRDDGPAVEYPGGAREWWSNSILIGKIPAEAKSLEDQECQENRPRDVKGEVHPITAGIQEAIVVSRPFQLKR